MTFYDYDARRVQPMPFGAAAAFTLRAFDGVRTRRIMAVGVDVCIVAALCFVLLPALLGLLGSPLGPIGSLGGIAFSWFVAPTLLPVAAFFYNGLTVSGRGRGTPGMRLFDLQVLTAEGARASFLHAALHGVLFYLTWMFPPLFLVCLLTPDKSCLHDIVAGVRIVRRSL